jgi:pyruvate dehydrogenase E1 component
VPTAKPTSTQEAFGRILTRLGDVEGVGERIVTTSPDVSVSTNLGGWINKMGVFAPHDEIDFLGEDRLLRWKQSPAGRHIELGISEMNLFLLLYALGLGHDLHGEHLLPVGTVYDPFVCRGLDALVYGVYSGSRFVVVGTPAGVTLAPEGGAHQSAITPSIGLELPGLTYAEPCFAPALDWLLCDGLARLADPDGTSLYLRLSTRPIDHAPFAAARERLGEEQLRSDVVAGGYRLREPSGGPAAVVLATCGAVVPEVLAAAGALEDEGVPALVLDLTSPDRLYRRWRQGLRGAGREATAGPGDHHLATLLGPDERRLPIVTVHDAASHHLAWLGGVFGAPVVPVGVDEFGQSGSIPELYGVFDLLPDQLVNAALVALTRRDGSPI